MDNMSQVNESKVDFDAAVKSIEAEIVEATKEAELKNEAYQVTEERNSIALREALVANLNLNTKHQKYRDMLLKAKEETRFNNAVQMAIDERLRASRASGSTVSEAQKIVGAEQ